MPIAQLDRALVSGTRFVGGSNPSGRAYKIDIDKGMELISSLVFFLLATNHVSNIFYSYSSILLRANPSSALKKFPYWNVLAALSFDKSGEL